MFSSFKEPSGERAHAITEGLRADAVTYFEDVLTGFGYEAIVCTVENSLSDIAVYITEYRGQTEVTKEVYEQFLRQFQLDRSQFDKYSNKDFTLEYDQEGKPYLRMTVIA